MVTSVDSGLLLLRIIAGLLFAGHGAQKLFGWFGGKGFEQHIALMRKMNFHPAVLWGTLSACSEFFGGLGLVFGVLTPLAAAALLGPMLVAIIKVHWSKGLWASNGGFEFPLLMGTAAFAIGLVGPGLYSIDRAFALTLPEPITYVVAIIVVLVGVGAALLPLPSGQPEIRRPL